MPDFPVLVEDVTTGWLAEVLGGRVDAVEVEPVGTGQIGTCYRLRLTGADVPASVIAKLPVVDPAARAMVAGAYRAEARFYRDIAATVDIEAPVCHHVDVDESGDFVLLLADLAPAVQGDQIGGCTVDEARAAVANLAGLHGPRWCDPSLHDIEGMSLPDDDIVAGLTAVYGPATDTFLADIGPLLDREDHETLRAVPDVIGAWILDRTERFGLVHGDYRLDNMLFPVGGLGGGSGAGVTAVDWQTLGLGLPARDLSYFVATSLEPADRATHERELVAAYHAALPESVRAAYPLATCWDDYVFAMLQVPLTAVLGQVYGASTERGDRMFAAMVRRGCAAIRDLGTLAAVAAGAGPVTA